MTDDPDSVPASQPDRQAFGSQYLLDAVVGSGAVGDVWHATTREGQAVAIKILRSELSSDPAVVSRFVQESHLLTDVHDQHVVAVRDLVVEQSRLGIVMDFVEGPDLRTELARRGTFAPIEAAQIVDGVLEGLSAVHSANIVHRDIKPENILLDQGDPGAARLTDFGVSRLIEASRTARRTTVIGTPEYIAPEVADGQTPTPASDLYSAGIMLYELMAGVTPFAADSPLAVLRRHAEQAPVKPGGMPEPLWSVVANLLAKNPADRPASAEAARQSLQAVAPEIHGIPAMAALSEPPSPAVTHQPTVMGARQGSDVDPAGPPTPVASKRNRNLLIAAGAVLVLVAAGIGIGIAAGGGSDGNTQVAAPVAAVTSAPASTEDATPSDSATPTPSASTPEKGTVPSVVNMSLYQATNEIEGAGLTVKTVEKLTSDPSVDDNTVTAQDPAAGVSLEPQGVVTLTVARQAVGVFLSDLGTVQSSNSSADYGQQTVNGTTYLHSTSVRTSCYGDAQSLQFDLGRHYQSLTMMVGISDSSPSQASVAMDVLVDGRNVSKVQSTLGVVTPLTIDVTGVLRLQIDATRTDGSCDGPTAVAVWGDAELFGAPDEVPATATGSPTNS